MQNTVLYCLWAETSFEPKHYVSIFLSKYFRSGPKKSVVPAIHSKEEVCELERLREENRALRDEIASLHGDMTELRRYRATDAHTTDWKLEFIQTKQELSKSKEAVQGEDIRGEIKRLHYAKGFKEFSIRPTCGSSQLPTINSIAVKGRS